MYEPKHTPKHAHYLPKHAAPREPSPTRNRVVGAAVAGSASLVTGVAVSAPAEAVGGVWDSVAACESGGNWAINTGNGFFGGLQFTASTWRGFGGTRFAPRADLASKAAQIATAQRVLVVQGPRAWPVCSVRAGLNRANGATTLARSVGIPASRSSTRAPVKHVKAVQHVKLAVDSVIGPLTTRATQRWVGTTPDGILGPMSVMALQRKVGSRPDGVIGPRTVRALQVKIGARPDGASRLNAATVSALQKYLNSH